MARHLNYNPGRDSVEYLEAINCGENRLHILEQLLISLRGEIGRPNHQHHLIIGPRGAGKTHLLRILTAGRIPVDPVLAAAYLPVVMPEETTLRTPGDLFLKFVERLSEQLREPLGNLMPNVIRSARGACLSALTTAKGMRDPLERLELMAGALESAAKALGRILLPIAENMDQTFYLGAQRGRKGPLDEQWALRRYLQESPHLLIIGAAPSLFGAVSDPGKPFYDFFRSHNLSELSNDEMLEVICKRLEYENANPGPDEMRVARVRCLLEHFAENSPQMRGVLIVTGGLPRFIHLIYEVVVETDVSRILDTLNRFLDDLTPYFQGRLDPRLIPQPEIDLLHTLALARGPLQPSELAEELYGVATNEVSELLSRLQERGMVKRAGSPGGRAMTWDLTEPLFRVWTQFRDNPEGQNMYRLLGKFVAMLFTLPEIELERKRLTQALSCMPESSSMRYGMLERDKMLEQAVRYHLERQCEPSVTEAAPAQSTTESSAAKKARDLFRSHFVALKEGVGEQSQDLLEELRNLSRATLDDALVQEMLAKGIFNAFNYAQKARNSEQCQLLLNELRALYRANPDDLSVRETLAKGLFNAIYDAGKTGDREQSQALLEELRTLSIANPYDAFVREPLAKGLFRVLYQAGEEGDMKQIRALLEELRVLVRANPDDAPLRETLAQGLFNAIKDAGNAGDIEQSRALLEELRTFNRANPDDALVRGILAKGLFNSLIDAGNAGDAEQSRALLEELRTFNRANPDDLSVRESLAKGLFNSLIDVGNAGDAEQSRALLEELRTFNRANPDDLSVRESLAKGLFNSLNGAGNAGDTEQSRALLEELRALNRLNPDDISVRENLADGLVNSINSAVNKEECHPVLEELRNLSLANPYDTSIREKLAMGLVNSLNVAGKAGDTKHSRAMLEELRTLSQANPDDVKLRFDLTFGLANSIAIAGKNGELELGYAQLEELRQIYQKHTNEVLFREGMARGLVNAIICSGIEKNKKKGQVLLKEIRSLYQSNPSESVLREGLARGLVNYISYFGIKRDKKQGDLLLKELRQLHKDHPDDSTLREQLAKGLLSTFNATQKEGDNERGQALLEELLNLVSQNPDETVEEVSLSAIFTYCKSLITLMKSGDSILSKERMRWLDSLIPSDMAALLRPVTLAMDVLEKGEDQALAREPEEVRRVVRLLLEKVS